MPRSHEIRMELIISVLVGRKQGGAAIFDLALWWGRDAEKYNRPTRVIRNAHNNTITWMRSHPKSRAKTIWQRVVLVLFGTQNYPLPTPQPLLPIMGTPTPAAQ